MRRVVQPTRIRTFSPQHKPTSFSWWLFSKYAGNLKPALLKFNAQYGSQVEARESQSLHDRLIFIDGVECWVLGASIKDAAKKATYLAPLEHSVSILKLGYYENTWSSGVAI